MNQFPGLTVGWPFSAPDATRPGRRLDLTRVVVTACFMAKVPQSPIDFMGALDTVIKAPLWFFMAGAVLTGVPLLNLPALVRLGVASTLRVGGLPIAFAFLGFFALFVSSAAARTMTAAIAAFSGFMEPARWWLRLRGLPPKARALLAFVEEQAVSTFFFSPDSEGLGILRDKGFLRAEAVDNERRWGAYRFSMSFERALRKHSGLFRKALRSSPDEIGQVRRAINLAAEAAARRR